MFFMYVYKMFFLLTAVKKNIKIKRVFPSQMYCHNFYELQCINFDSSDWRVWCFFK